MPPYWNISVLGPLHVKQNAKTNQSYTLTTHVRKRLETMGWGEFMIQNWIPEKIFLSHSSKDKDIVDKVEHYLHQKQYKVYVAERKMVGYPLILKLKEQLLDSNALILTWTKNANIKKSSKINAFEIGMAF